MTDKIDIDISERDLTKPPDVEKKAPILKQVPIRIHRDDHALLRIILKKDSMSWQKFIEYCVRGYLDADPSMIKMLRTYRELELIPKDVKDKHVLSHRERSAIFDEIERKGDK